jgi:serine/threonine protein phosphatase PrpC
MESTMIFYDAVLIIILAAALCCSVFIYIRKKKTSGGIKINNIQELGRRESQQDSLGTSNIFDGEKGVISIIADGMGGIEGGADMSKLAVSTFLSEFNDTAKIADPVEFLRSTVMKTQQEARAIIPPGKLSGTTLIAAFIKGNELHFVSVGDSRICVFRDGELIKLNREHNVASDVDEMAAAGLISIEDARLTDGRSRLTSYIGTPDRLMIDRNIKPFRIATGDIILLMTDGVFGTIDNNVLADALSSAVKSGNLKTAGDKITESVHAVNKSNQDNFSAIMLSL